MDLTLSFMGLKKKNNHKRQKTKQKQRQKTLLNVEEK